MRLDGADNVDDNLFETRILEVGYNVATASRDAIPEATTHDRDNRRSRCLISLNWPSLQSIISLAI
jgi:hypothetical protein